MHIHAGLIALLARVRPGLARMLVRTLSATSASRDDVIKTLIATDIDGNEAGIRECDVPAS